MCEISFKSAIYEVEKISREMEGGYAEEMNVVSFPDVRSIFELCWVCC